MPISRRGFLGGMGASLLASAEGARAFGHFQREPATHTDQFAYVSSEADGAHGIHVFRVGERGWQHLQFVPSTAPASLALRPDRKTLFVANRVRSSAGLPTGSVESYRIDDVTGTLTPISRQHLALAATEPEHLAVSPDGCFLAVAASEGSYNVLPVVADGSLLPMCSLRKDIGMGAHPVLQASAHPRQVLFDVRQRLLGADSGLDTVSLFAEDEGLLSVRQRVRMQPGSGPNVMCFDRTGTVLCVGSRFQPSIVARCYDVHEGSLASDGHTLARSGAAQGAWHAFISHPEADLMLGAWSDGKAATLACWRVDVERGELTPESALTHPGCVTALARFDGEPSRVLALDRSGEQIFCLRWDAVSGTLSRVSAVAAVPQPRAVVVRRVSDLV